MRRIYLAIGLATLVSLGWGGRVLAQSPLYEPAPGPRLTTFEFPPWGPTGGEDFPDAGLWGSAEYLIWWIPDAPIAAPLVTTNATAPGALPGSRILWGAGSGASTAFGALNGARLTLGGWLGDGNVGLEVSGFALEQGNVGFGARAIPTGPVVAVPFLSTQATANGTFQFPAGEAALSGTGNDASGLLKIFKGNANTISSGLTSRLWGFDVNGLGNLYEDGMFRVWALAGFRYLDLNETLSLTNTLFQTGTTSSVSISDNFGTRNRFYGAQIGVKTGVFYEGWDLDLVFKVALGANGETSTIAGTTRVTGGAFGLANGTTATGLLAQNSNIGTLRRSPFAVVPELQWKLSYFVADWVRPFIGYNILYVSDVLRPGDQIDRRINLTQNTVLGSGPLSAPLEPVHRLNATDFFAHGLNLGVEFRY